MFCVIINARIATLLLFSVIIKIMLEKNENILYFDAHFHYAVCKDNGLMMPDFKWAGLSCAHSISEWNIQSQASQKVFQAFALHPQSSVEFDEIQIAQNADFLESLLENNKLDAIGEAGFDYFTSEYKNAAALQEKMWNIQLALAKQYKIPLVVHCRKANEKLFEYSSELKKLPFVLFHSFMGSDVEAFSLVKRGINCGFSFGKQMLNNNKKVISCVRELPLENLFMETDAPFQTLKGETLTKPSDIKKVYNAAWELRGKKEDFFEFAYKMKNHYNLFYDINKRIQSV